MWTYQTSGTSRTEPALHPDGSVVYFGSDDGKLHPCTPRQSHTLRTMLSENGFTPPCR